LDSLTLMRFFTPKRKESIIIADAFNEVPQGMRNPAKFGGVLPETYHD